MDRVQALLDMTATREEVEAVRRALEAAGLEGPLEASVPHQGEEMWLVLRAIPATQFLQGFASEAGADAWRHLKQFFDSLRRARAGGPTRPGQVLVRPNVLTRNDIDPDRRSVVLPGWPVAGDTSTEVTLSTEMPDEAYRDLFDLDLAQFQGMTLFWDSVDGRWRATPKEVRREGIEE